MIQSLAEAKAQLFVALQKQRALIAEIKTLRQYINLFEEKPNLEKRNKEMYNLYKQGASHKDLSLKFSLSKDTVQSICKRQAYREQKKRNV